MTFQELYAKITAPFDRFPSPVNEGVFSALGTVLLSLLLWLGERWLLAHLLHVHATLHGGLLALFIAAQATLLSYIYERFIDPHGWELEDFEQRETGICCYCMLLVLA